VSLQLFLVEEGRGSLPRVGARPHSVRVVAWKGGLPQRVDLAAPLRSPFLRRGASRTQSQVMNVVVLFNPISNFRRLHFETAQSAFPLDKDSEQIRSQYLQCNESSRDCCRSIVRSDFLFFMPFGRGTRTNTNPYDTKANEGGTLTLNELIRREARF
jgi:hypothetical protein